MMPEGIFNKPQHEAKKKKKKPAPTATKKPHHVSEKHINAFISTWIFDKKKQTSKNTQSILLNLV